MGELDLAPPALPPVSVCDGPRRVPRSPFETAGWALLCALLAALTFDRVRLPAWSDEIARHPTLWSGHPHSYYSFRFRLPGAPPQPIGFRLRPAHALIGTV